METHGGPALVKSACWDLGDRHCDLCACCLELDRTKHSERRLPPLALAENWLYSHKLLNQTSRRFPLLDAPSTIAIAGHHTYAERRRMAPDTREVADLFAPAPSAATASGRGVAQG